MTWPSGRKWLRLAREIGQGWMCPSTTSFAVPARNKWGAQRRQGRVRRGSVQVWEARRCVGSSMMASAPSRIASSLIAVRVVWGTTQNECATVDRGETFPDRLLVSPEAIVDRRGSDGERNSGGG